MDEIITYSGIMEERCAWCDQRIGFKPCAPENDGSVSHGACLVCTLKLREEIERERQREENAAKEVEYRASDFS